MRLLRRLADDGSTVTLTTHATKNVMLCDKVVFLARGGHLAFVGAAPPRAALLRGRRLRRHLPAAGRGGEPRGVGRAVPRLRRLPPARGGAAPARACRAATAPTAAGARRQRSRRGGLRRGLRQFAVLSRRSFDLYAKNPKVLPSLDDAADPVLAARAGACSRATPARAATNSAAALQIMFLIAFSAFIFGLLFAIQEIVKEFPIFRRERMVNLGVVPVRPLEDHLPGAAARAADPGDGRHPAGDRTSAGRRIRRLRAAARDPGAHRIRGARARAAHVGVRRRSSQQATDMLSVWIMPQVLFGGALRGGGRDERRRARSSPPSRRCVGRSRRLGRSSTSNTPVPRRHVADRARPRDSVRRHLHQGPHPELADPGAVDRRAAGADVRRPRAGGTTVSR